MKFGRIIDLSYELEPGHETRIFSIKRIPIREYKKLFPYYIPTKDDPNYPMHMIQMVSHIGTHIETPYHYKMKGNDLAQVPLEQLVGETIILDLTGVKPKERISLEKVKKAAKGLKGGDIVFCRTGYGRGDRISARSKEERLFQAPYFSIEAIQWLIKMGMKVFGVETEMEDLASGSNVNHHALFSHGIPLIENLTNLDKLRKKRVFVFILPPKIKKLEGFPVRVIAIE
jgi:arylformamidase